MSDVQEHPIEDSNPDAPEASDQPEVDWQKRYSDLQPEYTRASQEAAEYRRLVDSLRSDDSDTRRTAAEKLGLEFIEDEEPETDEYEDPTEVLRRELDEIKQSISQRDQQAQAEAARTRDINHLDAQLSAIEKQAGIELTDEETKLLAGFALANRDDKNLPDVETAWQIYQAAENGLKKRWASTKKAPHVSPVGRAGTDAPNLDNARERQEWMQQKVRDMDNAA